MGSTYPSPSPQRAAVARRLSLIVDRGGQGEHRREPRKAHRAAAESVHRAAVRGKDDNREPHSTFSKGRGQGVERGRRGGVCRTRFPGAFRLEARPPLGKSGRRQAATSALLPAAAAAAAPPRAQPGLLSGSPRPRPTLSGTGGRGRGEGEGEEAGRTGGRREWRESWAP